MLVDSEIQTATSRTIRTAIEDLLTERNIPFGAIEDETALAELNITSLDLAELISNFEDMFGVDPFEEHIPITSIVQVKDLYHAYSQALGASVVAKDELAAELISIRKMADSAEKFKT